VNALDRGEPIQLVVMSWLISNGHLVFEEVETDSDMAGNA
jgi:hypothetical protein